LRLAPDTAGFAGGRVAATLAAAVVGLLLAAVPASAQGDPPEPGPVPSTPIPITPACPDTAGVARVNQRGGEVVGTCWGNAAQAPGYQGVSAASVWNWYGCDQWRPYSSGSRVSAVNRSGDQPLLLEDIVARGLDPTVVYYWYNVECEHHSTGPDGDPVIELWGWGLLVIGDGPPVDPLVLRDRAASRINPEPPTPFTSPPWNEIPSVVQMPTWLWLADGDWVTAEESERANYVTVAVQARPVDHTWVFGDGSAVVCPNGPGVAWWSGAPESGTYCSHVFTEANAQGYAASVTVRWVFHWWLNGNDMGDFGELTRVSSFTVPVSEIQAIEVS
jgi:hypothetical protein